MKFWILYTAGLLAVSSCVNDSEDAVSESLEPPMSVSPSSSTSFNEYTYNGNGSSSLLFPKNANPDIRYQGRVRNYTIEDFWSEAEDIQYDAESILSYAEDIGCDEAIRAARNAISLSDDCMNSNEYSDAESYLDEAESELSDAKNYLEDCEYSRNNEDEGYDEDY